MSRSFYRFSFYLRPILLIILPFIIVFPAALLAFNILTSLDEEHMGNLTPTSYRLATSTNVSTEDSRIPTSGSMPIPTASANNSPQCHLTVQNDDPSLQEVARRYYIAFNAACPLLVKRFALRPDIANNVTLSFSSNLPSGSWGEAHPTESAIIVNANMIRENPKEDVTTLIHELTHIIQYYSSGEPNWFQEGMADYAAEVYRPADQLSTLYDAQDPEKRTDNPGKHYTQGYGVAARFLVWLEQRTVPTFVDQLNRAIQTEQSFSETFQRLTGGTVDQLWSKYKANPNLGPIRRVIIPDN